jgi:hypothetical protein
MSDKNQQIPSLVDYGKFDPRNRLIDMKNKLYLETRWRQVWFRRDHPKGSIVTELISMEPIAFKATVYDGDGVILGTGFGSAVSNKSGNAVWTGRELEKAETAAKGRALGAAGYSTEFCAFITDDLVARADEELAGMIGGDDDETIHLGETPGELDESNPSGKTEPESNPSTQRKTTTRPAEPPKSFTMPKEWNPKGKFDNQQTAGAFIQYWRNNSMPDAEVLEALGVEKLSLYKGTIQQAFSAVMKMLAKRQ